MGVAPTYLKLSDIGSDKGRETYFCKWLGLPKVELEPELRKVPASAAGFVQGS